jgi:IS30 family transposase
LNCAHGIAAQVLQSLQHLLVLGDVAINDKATRVTALRVVVEGGKVFFFAHPYSSWERGANENMNGLIRQFFPKKMAFEFITTNDVELAMHQLNHRPRKCLGYRTPHEVFMEQLQLHNPKIALQT